MLPEVMLDVYTTPVQGILLGVKVNEHLHPCKSRVYLFRPHSRLFLDSPNCLTVKNDGAMFGYVVGRETFKIGQSART